MSDLMIELDKVKEQNQALIEHIEGMYELNKENIIPYDKSDCATRVRMIMADDCYLTDSDMEVI